MRYVFVIFALVLVAAGPGLWAQEGAPAADLGGRDQLERVAGPFAETWIRPDADLARFHQIHFEVDTLQYRATDVSQDPSPRRSPDSKGYVLDSEDRQRFRETVTAAMVDELGGSKTVALVDAAGPGTLSIRASIFDIVVFVPPLPVGRVDVYPSEVGAATVRFELVDPDDGSLLASLEERRTIRPRGRIASEVPRTAVNRLTMWGEIGLWSRHAASDLLRFIASEQSS